MLRIKAWYRRTFVAFVFMATVVNFAHAQSTDLLTQFTTQGLKLTESVAVTLPLPLLEGKSPDQAKSELNKLSVRQGWDRFSKNSPTSPIHVELSYVLQDGKSSESNLSKDGKRIGHNIHSAFIAYYPLKSLQDEQLMSSLFGTSSEDKQQMGFDPIQLDAEVLKSVGIEQIGPNTRYSTLRIPLMNRVVIEGTARIDRLDRNGSLIVAWQLDPHFSLDNPEAAPAELAKYINRSRKESRDELGKLTQSALTRYSGCGGYVSVTATGQAENQLLIESRLVMMEPDDWFSGSNFLRSKFPSAMQESAQNFRRKLK